MQTVTTQPQVRQIRFTGRDAIMSVPGHYTPMVNITPKPSHPPNPPERTPGLLNVAYERLRRHQRSDSVTASESGSGDVRSARSDILLFGWLNANYLAVMLLSSMILLGLLFPCITPKTEVKKKIEELKEILQVVAAEVFRAEENCQMVAANVKALQKKFSSQDSERSSISRYEEAPNTSQKEMPVMTYFYTESFDNTKK